MKINPSRISQIVFLLIFAILFVMTEYRGKDEISVAINSFFRANPLVVLSFMLSAKTLVFILIPGLMMILFTAILGRFFCGWICPLGTIIDLITDRIKKTSPIKIFKTRLKYYILLILLTAALFNVNIAGIFDPIAILVRALTFFIYPLFGWTIKAGWIGLYNAIGDKRDYLDFFYRFLRDYILPFRETFYPLAFVSLAFLLFIILLERYETRNWCRNLCPLGTLLGLLGRLSIFKRIPIKPCNDCGRCRDICPTGFDSDILQKQDCILCMDCRLKCGFNRIRFSIKRTDRQKNEPVPIFERRVFLTGIISGFALSKAFTFKMPSENERLLRPPGVEKEDEFLKKCVRCGECIKVCLKNALYPSILQGGIYGIFTPVIIPRLGYCEYNCNLCGQVCPTGAIPNLPLEKKKKSIIGVAVIDKNHCLPYAKKINCIVCEEHCPVTEKAIRFEQVSEIDYKGRPVKLKRPYIVEELCTGCGICENKCPLEGKSAIEVFSKRKRHATGSRP
ncbi:MAG TPA: 4Fe-4S binding protein [Syntrophorhabdaceae bacterium]|nr:4Fe-4S binding protein [Syntrophorhabdaceae bacterium]HPP40892.1 4Fe-4S binding protein [Syntrophorhabdaceae bacterium]